MQKNDKPMILSDLSLKHWIVAAVSIGAGVGTILGTTALWLGGKAETVFVVALLSGATLAGTVLAFGLLYRKLGLLYRELCQMQSQAAEHDRQLTAWINIRPLLGWLPVNVGGWAMDPLFAEVVAKTILETRPRLVVECGSGASTVLIAACLSKLGSGRVVSLDHDADYAEKTRRQLSLLGLEEFAQVVTAPLVETNVEGRSYQWYDFDPNSLPGDVDCLVVDGPPAATGVEARYPALPLLLDRMAGTGVVLMDDGDRPDETTIAHRWGALLGTPPEHVLGGKGGWVLRRPQPVAAVATH